MRKDVTAKCYGGDATQKAEASRKAEKGEGKDEGVRIGFAFPRKPSSLPYAWATTPKGSDGTPVPGDGVGGDEG